MHNILILFIKMLDVTILRRHLRLQTKNYDIV